MELPEQAEDQVYYQLLKMAGKSMLEMCIRDRYCEGDTICPAFFEETPLLISGNSDAFFW